MENIAEALRMAAGVLLAVLLISVMVYIFQTVNVVEEERQQQVLIAQVTEFNNTYNAYDKSSMYGTDVMSVVSMAINNNRDLNGSVELHPNGAYNPDLDGSVNIKVKIAKDIVKYKTYVMYTDMSDPTNLITVPRELEGSRVVENYFDVSDYSGAYLELTKSSTVEKFQNMITEDKRVEVKKKITENGLREETTIKDDYGIDDFKKRIFTCTDVKYSQSGRIYEMTFEDITPNEELESP